MTEFVDLYPSLVEAAGLPLLDACPDKSQNITTCTEGKSFMPLIKNPSMPWKKAVFSQYAREHEHGGVMGYTIRTDRDLEN